MFIARNDFSGSCVAYDMWSLMYVGFLEDDIVCQGTRKVCIELQSVSEGTRDDYEGDFTSCACAGILRLVFGRG